MTSANSPLSVLLTNDDGVHAPGLFAMKKALVEAGHEVTVCAPDRPRSASGHAITLHKPLRLKQVALADGSSAWAASGTPADSVVLGLLEVMSHKKVHLTVSGINHGPNLGWDVTYSGTVSAALESVINGVPAVSVSVATYDDPVHWTPVAKFVAGVLAPEVGARGLPPATLLNVNAPNVSGGSVRGVRITTQASRQYVDRLEKRIDPAGRPYFWQGGRLHNMEAGENTDTRAVSEGYISITPVHLDVTAYSMLPELRDWRVTEWSPQSQDG